MKSDKLWTKNFFLLVQGQLVSTIGTNIYNIVLGFWVLDLTKSTAIMGFVLATTGIVSLFVSPVAGVIVDRYKKTVIIILVDLIQGVILLILCVFIFSNMVKIWMLFCFAICSGICLSFFAPAIQSLIPLIVNKNKLMQANAIRNLINNICQIIGKTLAGVLYLVLSPAMLFFINGISFIFSSFTELFIKPGEKIQKSTHKKFFNEIREGYRFVWNNKGLRNLLFSSLILNFFAYMGLTLFLPLFKRTPGLGPALYGVAVSCIAFGHITGAVLINIFKIPAKKRFIIFLISTLGMTGLPALIPVVLWFPAIIVIAYVGGIMQSFVFCIYATVLQLITPKELRGRVFSFVGVLSNFLIPLGIAIGGVLAEFISLHFLISFGFKKSVKF